LEGELADQQLSGLLVTTNLTKSDGSCIVLGLIIINSVAVGLPGLYLWGFLTPPVEGADFLAALEASCLRGALPPVDCIVVSIDRGWKVMWYLKLRENASR
jgi:hypothetical protein